MVSRASSWDNIGISQEMYNMLYKKFAKHLSCPLNFQIRANTTITCKSEELCNLNNSDFINLLQYTTSAVSPSGFTGVSLSQIVYNMSGITQTYASTKATQICTNTTFIGTRKSGGRGHKSTSSLTRAQKLDAASYQEDVEKLLGASLLFKQKHAELIQSISLLYNNLFSSSSSLYRCDTEDNILDEYTQEPHTQVEQTEHTLTFEEARALLWTKYSDANTTNYTEEPLTMEQILENYYGKHYGRN